MTCRRSVRWQIGFRRALSVSKDLLLGQIGELLAKALEIAEGVLVDDADQTEEFQQRVLQRRRRQQQLVAFLQRLLSVLAMTFDGL